MITIECGMNEINEGFEIIVDKEFAIKVKGNNKEVMKYKPIVKKYTTAYLIKDYFESKKNGEIVTRMDLRNQKFINNTDFATWVEDNMPRVINELGYVYEHVGAGNTKGWIIKR